MIAVFNVGRLLMLVWIIYGLLLIFAPGILHQSPNQMGGAIQVAIAFGIGYLMDRGISAVHRRRATKEGTDSAAEQKLDTCMRETALGQSPLSDPSVIEDDAPTPMSGGNISDSLGSQLLMRNELVKNCPYCAEEILLAAIKCQHCQSVILMSTLNDPARNHHSETSNTHCLNTVIPGSVPVQKDKVILRAILGVVAFICFVGHFLPNKEEKLAVTAPESAPAKTQPIPDSPAMLNDANALDEKYGIEATIRCGSHADDYLRSTAKYAFKWDEMGFGDFKFDSYMKAVSSPGVLTSISNKVSLQNGLGAYERIELFCDYDTQSKKIIAYSVGSPPTHSAASEIDVPSDSSTSDEANENSQQRDFDRANASDDLVLVREGGASQASLRPEFDCVKAMTLAENLICRDEELAMLDRENASLYRQAQSAAPDEMELTRSHREEWRRKRNECVDKHCVLQWYSIQNSELSALIDAASVKPNL